MFTLKEIIRALSDKEISINDCEFIEAVIDSRNAAPSTLFVAIPGEQTDGHKYVSSAFAGGASAALIQEDVPGDYCVIDLRNGKAEITGSCNDQIKPLCIRVSNTIEALQKIAAWHRKQLPQMDVIGITGTVGKTTTKELIFDVLSGHYKALKTPGNMNNEIGLPLTLLHAGKETEQAILEMGFYVPGEIDQLCRIADPSVGVITNVGMVHASRAGSMEVIAQGKSELVRYLPAGGTAILNYDDPYVRPMKELTKANVLYYGLDHDADLYADNIESFGLDGLKFDMFDHQVKHHIEVPLIGRHSVMTALRGAAVGLAKGLSWDEITDALRSSRNQLRMRITHAINGGLLIDDTYNASPESTLAALNLFAEIKGRRIAVLGEMRELGQYEKKGHEMVGKKAAEVSDELIAVGPATKYLADAAVANGMKPENVHWFESTPESVEYLRAHYGKENEVILIKGSRGMRMEQIVSVLEDKA